MSNKLALISIIACALISFTVAQITCKYSSSNDDYISSLKTDLKVCTYAGLLPIKESASIFYWFFESAYNEREAKEIPVVVYINGDVGTSSLTSIFQLNGPLRLDENNKFLYQERSWLSFANVLYIDFPEGVGFSTSGDLRKKDSLSRADLQQDFITVLSKFSEKYSDTRILKWYLAAETYSAHLAVDLLQEVLKRKDILKLDFRGLLIGDPLLDASRQQSSFFESASNLGLVGPDQLDEYTVLVRNCETNNDKCRQVSDYLRQASGKVDFYDVRNTVQSVSDDFVSRSNYPELDRVIGYFNKTANEATLRELLHLNTSTKAPLWNYENNEYIRLLANHYKTPVVSTLRTLSSSVKVLAYYGQFDIKFGYNGGLALLPDLVPNVSNLTRNVWEGSFWEQSRSTGGLFHQSGNLTLMLLNGVGRFVHRDKAGLSSILLKNFVYDLPYCNDCNTSAQTSVFMNNCSGHGVWVGNLSVCNCTDGYADADCSVQLSDFPEGKDVSLGARQWAFYRRKLDSDKVFSFDSQSSQYLDVYIAYDRIARALDNDFGISSLSLNSSNRRVAVQKNGDSTVYISVRNNNYTSSVNFKARSENLVGEPSMMDDVKRPVVIVAIVLIIVSVIIIIGAIVMCCKNRSSGGLLGGRL